MNFLQPEEASRAKIESPSALASNMALSSRPAQPVQARPRCLGQARSSLRPCGLPSSLSLVGASMISLAAFPAAASLGQVRWAPDSLYDNAKGRAFCRGLVYWALGFLKESYASLRGPGGSGSNSDNASHNALRDGSLSPSTWLYDILGVFAQNVI